MTRTVTIIGKPGCHLCDEAKAVVDKVLGELGPTRSIELEEQSILDDADLHARYWEQIPVVLIDGRQHTFWRVDEVQLIDALGDADD